MLAQLAILACVVLLSGCEKIIEKHWNAPTDDPNWMAGYQEGLDQGTDRGHDQVCDEIMHYKPAMAHDLDENTEICGYDSNDQPATQPKKT